MAKKIFKCENNNSAVTLCERVNANYSTDNGGGICCTVLQRGDSYAVVTDERFFNYFTNSEVLQFVDVGDWDLTSGIFN